MPRCPPKSQNCRIVEGSVIFPTVTALERYTELFLMFTYCSGLRSAQFCPVGDLGCHCKEFLSSPTTSVDHLVGEEMLFRCDMRLTVFPAPSSPRIITENSSFLPNQIRDSNLGTRWSKPREVLVKPFEKMVHYTRAAMVD